MPASKQRAALGRKPVKRRRTSHGDELKAGVTRAGICHGPPNQGITAGSKEERADDRRPNRDRGGNHDQ